MLEHVAVTFVEFTSNNTYVMIECMWQNALQYVVIGKYFGWVYIGQINGNVMCWILFSHLGQHQSMPPPSPLPASNNDNTLSGLVVSLFHSLGIYDGPCLHEIAFNAAQIEWFFDVWCFVLGEKSWCLNISQINIIFANYKKRDWFVSHKPRIDKQCGVCDWQQPKFGGLF